MARGIGAADLWKANPNYAGTAVSLELWRNGIKISGMASD